MGTHSFGAESVPVALAGDLPVGSVLESKVHVFVWLPRMVL